MNRMKEMTRKYREIIVYVFFGIATTAVNWIVYTIMVAGLQCNVTFSNAIAWFAAVAFAFWGNKVFVFRSTATGIKKVAREAASFLGVRVLSGIVEIFLPAALIFVGIDMALFGIEGFAAKAIASVFVIVLNYILSKLLIFHKKH